MESSKDFSEFGIKQFSLQRDKLEFTETYDNFEEYKKNKIIPYFTDIYCVLNTPFLIFLGSK